MVLHIGDVAAHGHLAPAGPQHLIGAVGLRRQALEHPARVPQDLRLRHRQGNQPRPLRLKLPP